MIRAGLLADDLTGALDSAAQFAAPGAGIPVVWEPLPSHLSAPFAVDAETREASDRLAADLAAGLAPLLAEAPLAFKKIDSLLRGPIVAELGALVGTGLFHRCIVAPALPFHGRITRKGRQYLLTPDGPRAVGPDLLRELGHLDGVSVADAETDSDLAEIVRAGLLSGDRILWCGTAGLAAALAGDPPPVPALDSGPMLAIVGSDHPVSLAQVDIARAAAIPILTFTYTAGTAREQASAAMAEQLAETIPRLPRPARVFAAGGETLAQLASVLQATRLEVEGQLLPGVPVSRFHDGQWRGVQVISKSGAFGGPNLLRELLSS